MYAYLWSITSILKHHPPGSAKDSSAGLLNRSVSKSFGENCTCARCVDVSNVIKNPDLKVCA